MKAKNYIFETEKKKEAEYQILCLKNLPDLHAHNLLSWNVS